MILEVLCSRNLVKVSPPRTHPRSRSPRRRAPRETLTLARDGAVPSMRAQTGMLQILGSTLTLSLGVPPTWRLVTWNT